MHISQHYVSGSVAVNTVGGYRCFVNRVYMTVLSIRVSCCEGLQWGLRGFLSNHANLPSFCKCSCPKSRQGLSSRCSSGKRGLFLIRAPEVSGNVIAMATSQWPHPTKQLAKLRHINEMMRCFWVFRNPYGISACLSPARCWHQSSVL
jgi:hypothetical protein